MKTKINQTVANLVSENIGADHVFGKYQIDFCCGGGLTLHEACEKKGISAEKVWLEIESIKNKLITSNNQEQENKHNQHYNRVFEKSNFLNENFHILNQYASKVNEVHGMIHPELSSMERIINSLNYEVAKWLSIFTETVEKAEKLSEEQASEYQHLEDNLINALSDLDKISNHFQLPENACRSYTFYFNMLKAFEDKFKA
ncbi:MAG: DUF542 domain-containing protein [Lutibacter sp.]